MADPVPLVAVNFQLTNEVKRLRSELVALRALRMHEDCLELERFKRAYDELAREVVELRRGVAIVEPLIPETPVDDNALVAALQDQIAELSTENADLRSRYASLRKEFVASPSTCASLDECLSMSKSELVTIAPVMEAVFTRPTTRRMVVVDSSTEVPHVSVPPAAVARKPTSKPDPSISRLAKKARFSLNK
jgi:hypothetical protein